jgi:SNF2 family DNA or RNA helicase
MKLQKFINSIFSKPNAEQYHIEPSGYGIRFHSLKHEECTKGSAPDALQFQYVTLQMLCEQGEAEPVINGFFLPDDVATRLAPDDRMLLGLPEPWPGRFELEIRGQSYSPSFRLELILVRPNQQRTKHYRLAGPLLILGEDEEYLPDESQYAALFAIQKHGALSEDNKTEGANLAAVYALQQAKAGGVHIDLRHFDDTAIQQPDKVSISIVEAPDGSLRLIPDFGLGDAPNDIEERLGQLEGADNTALRIGKRIVLLDEKRMEGVQEVLSNRQIPAAEKLQFLKEPTAFINASLVDLDENPSIRVHGAEVFQKAYFGETDAQTMTWFGDPDSEPDVFTLSDAGNFIKDREEFAELTKQVELATSKGDTSISFKDKTILLPANKEELSDTLAVLGKTISDVDEKAPRPVKPASHKEQNESQAGPNITVKIDLNDEDVADGFLTLTAGKCQLYSGPICGNGCKYKPFNYQREGICWLLGLACEALAFPERNRFGGALLADDMGLGKTFMTLAALQVYQAIIREQSKPKPTLVVAPVVLLENWYQEVENVFENSPFEDIVILQANADLPRYKQNGAGRETTAHQTQDGAETAIRYSLKVGKGFGNLRLDMPGRLVLTNYDTLRDYQFSMSRVDWGMVIFDEAQDIKNPNAMKSRAAKALKADFRLAVTGTPVENSLRDFWSIFDTVSPGFLGSYKEFNKTYISPINRATTTEKDATRVAVGKQLYQHVGELMLRRNKEDSLDGLPQKIIHDGGEDKSYCVMMNGIQQERYDAVIASVTAAKASGDTQKIQQAILPGLRRLRDVSLHPDLLDGGTPEASSSNAQKARNSLLKSEKLKLMLSILEEIKARDEKVIIFAINKKLQKALAINLKAIYGVEIEVVNGETKSVASRSGKGAATRKQLIDEFQSKPGFGIIIMSPLAAGVGLTVVGANNVIHLERHWNPAKEAQATDRVYRIGATKDVHVYIPVLAHPSLKSFDSNLQQLLAAKTQLKDAVISPTEIAPEDFDTEGMFGSKVPTDAPITADWLDTIDWTLFEALTAELAAKEFGGASYLTPASGDFGADVVTISERANVLIQCKCTKNALDDAKIALEPYNARPEYEARLNKKFDKLILCTNTDCISKKVYQKAERYGVEIWGKDKIATMLRGEKMRYTDVSARLTAEVLHI